MTLLVAIEIETEEDTSGTSGPNLSGPQYHPFLAREAFQSDRAAGMHSLLVEMPISAPSPYSKPSAKRVDVLTITELESTSRRKRIALACSAVTIASVCCEPYLAMWAMAPSSESTTRTARMGARYSVYQSCSVATFIVGTIARERSQPRSSTALLP